MRTKKYCTQLKPYANQIIKYFFILICIVIFLYLCNQSNFVQDDTYITLRYVENFLDGKGLVFNQGENVEGYTSFLWVMILSGIALTGINLVLASQMLSLTFGIAVILLTYFVSDKLVLLKAERSKNYFNLIPVYLLALTGAASYWSVSGMETSLFSFLVLLGVYFFIGSENNNAINIKFSITFLLASLTRPEGMFVFALIIFYKFISSKGVWKAILIELAILLIPLSLYLSFRLFYYGYPFPNTFYAKTGFTEFYLTRGLNYFWDFAKSYTLYGSFLLLPVFLWKARSIRETQMLFYFLCIVYISGIIIIGGDVLPMHRFFLPIIPLIYILVAKSLQYLNSIYAKDNLIKKNLFIVIIFFIISAGIIIHKNEKTKLNLVYRTEIGLVTKMKVYAEWLKEQQEKRSSRLTAAASTIGAVGYFSQAKIIDLLGLTDEFIAHNPKELTGLTEAAPSTWRENHYNADYVLDQMPDYIIFPAGAKPSGFPESAVFVNDRFITQYYVELIYSTELRQLLPIFTRRGDSQIAEAELKYDSLDCDERFIPHYIRANNLLLSYIQNKDTSYIPRIVNLCNKAVEICPKRKYIFYTLIGMTYFHSGLKEQAKDYLIQASHFDEMNSIPHFYLKNIFSEENNNELMIYHIRKLKNYSPDSLPQLL